MALLQRDRAGPNIFTSLSQVLSLLLPGHKRDLFAVSLRALLHNNAIGALRHCTARHDSSAFSGDNGFAIGLTGETGADLRQRRFGVAVEICKSQRPAIHRGIAMRRNIDRRNDVFGKNSV